MRRPCVSIEPPKQIHERESSWAAQRTLGSLALPRPAAFAPMPCRHSIDKSANASFFPREIDDLYFAGLDEFSIELYPFVVY
jgi:hypothetical protein